MCISSQELKGYAQNLCRFATALLLLATASMVSAQDLWTNSGTGDWGMTSNWSLGVIPTATIEAIVANGGTVQIVADDSPYAANQLLLGEDGGSGMLSMSGGMLSIGSGGINLGASGFNDGSTGGSGAITIVGGTLNVGGSVELGGAGEVGGANPGGNGGSGLLTFNGGTITINGGGMILGGTGGKGGNNADRAPGGNGGAGTLTIDDGSIAVNGGLVVGGSGGLGSSVQAAGGGGGVGTLTLSGGTLSVNSGGLNIGGSGGKGGIFVTGGLLGSISGNGGLGGNAILSLGTGSTLNVTGGVILGGSGGGAGENPSGVAGNGGAGGSGTLMLNGGSLHVSTGGITVGGQGGIDSLVLEGGGVGGTGGDGTLTLSGGMLTVSSGGITLGGAGGEANGSGSGGNGGNGTLTLSGGTLDVNGKITLGGADMPGGGLGGLGTLNLNSGTLTASAILVNVNVLNFGPTAGQTVTVNAPISGLSTQTVTFNTAGTVVLNGATDFGGVNLNAGILEVSADSALGASTGGLTFNGGTLETSASFTTNRTITLNAGGGTFNTASGTTLTVANTALVSGAGNLTKSGLGTLVLSGNNTYSGGTTIDAGTLEPLDFHSLGTGAVAVNSGATLLINSRVEPIQIGPLSGTGTVNLLADNGLAVSLGTGVTSTFSGTLEGSPPSNLSGSPSFILNGSGTLHLDGTTTLLGVIVANGGTLDLDSSTALSNNTFLEVAANAKMEVNGVNLPAAGLLNYTSGSNGSIVLNGGSLTIQPSSAAKGANLNFGGYGGLRYRCAGDHSNVIRYKHLLRRYYDHGRRAAVRLDHGTEPGFSIHCGWYTGSWWV